MIERRGGRRVTSYAFPRSSRLKRRSLIRPLFSRERDDVVSVAAGCIRLVMRVVPRTETGPDAVIQVGFAPGRRVRSAVRRNRLKRKLREVYRHHQRVLGDLFASTESALTLMVLFRGAADEESCIDRDLPRALQAAARVLA